VKKLLLGIAGVVALCSAPVMAAEMPLKVPPPAAVTPYDWTGIYLGGQAGWEWADVHDVCTLGCFPAFFTEDSKLSTWDIGLHGGIQKQFDHWLIGVEAALHEPGQDNSRSNFNSCAGPAFRCGLRSIADLATVGGKVGYAWNAWLLSAQGGWATGVLNRADFLFPNGGFCSGFTCAQGRADGWYVGGSLEYILSKGTFADLIAGVDYKYVRLNDTPLHDQAGGIHTLSENVNLVDFRLTLKFNPGFGGPIATRY